MLANREMNWEVTFFLCKEVANIVVANIVAKHG